MKIWPRKLFLCYPCHDGFWSERTTFRRRRDVFRSLKTTFVRRTNMHQLQRRLKAVVSRVLSSEDDLWRSSDVFSALNTTYNRRTDGFCIFKDLGRLYIKHFAERKIYLQNTNYNKKKSSSKANLLQLMVFSEHLVWLVSKHHHQPAEQLLLS